MRGFLLLLLLIGSALAITREEFKKDREYVSRVEKRLEELDREITKGNTSREVLGELNSYGYPLYTLKDKYIGESGKDYEKFYERVKRAYDRLLYVKRGAFPKVLMDEVRELKLPVCRIETSGKFRETLNIAVKDLKDESALTKLMTETQLRYAHLLGIEGVNFEKCK